MADGEHLSPQSRHLWIAPKSTPLPGTEKHPQGRLFAPTGSYAGDPMALAPENWMKQSATPAHSDILSWHGSEESGLARSDEYEHRAHDPGLFAGPDWGNEEYNEEGDYNEDFVDYSVDAKDRPMTDYGSAVGMHFGSLQAAAARAPRPFMHAVRIPPSTIAPPPRGSFTTERPGGTIAGGDYRSNMTILNQETGERTEDTRWSDPAANYASKATDLVEEGKTLAYRNDVEAAGSTSYRALPETVRTWSEDVMNAKRPGGNGVAGKYGWHDDPEAFRGTPHPALVHLAEAGYDPVVEPNKTPRTFNRYTEPMQMALPFGDSASYPNQIYEQAARVTEMDEENRANAARTAAFDAGRTWTLRKPD